MEKTSLLESMATHPNAPVFPSVAVRILDIASCPEFDSNQLRSLVEAEPTLCSRILKIINSPLYGLPRPIGAIGRAIQLMGVRPLRSLVLGYSLASLQKGNRQNTFDQEYWTASIAGGVIARELAIRLGRPEPEDDFSASLMRDIGMLFLDRIHGEAYRSIREKSADDWWSNQRVIEEKYLGVDHAEASAFYFDRLKLPEAMVEVARHHHATDEEFAALTTLGDPEGVTIARRATQAAATLMTQNRSMIEETALRFQKDFGFTPSEYVEFFETVTQKVEGLAEELGTPVSHLSFALASQKATTALADIALESSVHSNQCELKVTQSREEAIRWRRTAYRLRRQSTRDALTGIFNRAHFEEMLVTEFKRAQRRAGVIGLIFLDVDQFKQVNDTHGHAFGDRVLQAVARRIKQRVRASDSVARYGGDEFCVIVVDISPDGLRSLAQRLLEDIQEMTVSHGRTSTRVGVSMGAVCCLPRRADATFEQFLVASDEAMYAAKTQGKNRVHFRSMLSAEDEALMLGIQERLFSRFLEQQGVAPRSSLASAARESAGNAFFMGRLARRLGWIGPRRLRRILFEQRRTHEMFGEVAVRLNYLTKAQLYALLAIQQENPEEMVDYLTSEGLIESGRGRQLVAQFYRFVKSGAASPAPIPEPSTSA